MSSIEPSTSEDVEPMDVENQPESSGTVQNEDIANQTESVNYDREESGYC